MADDLEINPDDTGSLQSDLDILKEDESESEDKSEENKVEDETPTITEDEEVIEPEVEEEIVEEEGSRLRPSIKTMTTKHPELVKIFKDYPQLRDAYFREGKLSQFFPTIEDAEEASLKAESLDKFDTYFKEGSSKELLEALDKDTLKKFVTNFLPTLSNVNSDLFYDVSIPIVNTAIRNMYKTGEGNKDNNMMAAAKIMAHYLHGKYEIPEVEAKKNDPEIDRERKKLDDERRSLAKEKFEEFDSSVQDRTRELLSKAIVAGLDPNGTLSEFTKSKIIEEVIDRVGTELSNDRQHMASVNKLWKMAQNERFSSKAADRILSAFLSRAKRLIPEIRSKVKNEAIGGKKVENKGIARTTGRETTSGTNSSSSNNSKIPAKPNREFWKKNPSDRALLD